MLGGNKDDVDADEKIQKATDNRKVVVEDLVYIDDLQILIYTTIAPKTSQIFITSMTKVKSKEEQQADSKTQIITLNDLTEASKQEKAKLAAKMEQEKQMAEQNVMTNHY